MKLQQLGRTGIEVSAVGFGGIPIQRIDFGRAAEVIEAAISNGINFIDTARGYTNSEAKLGQIIGQYRKELVIATKTMSRNKGDMSRDIDKSLKELKTDYIDLYQCHNVKDEEALECVLAPGGALEALQEAKSSGKIRFIGITGHIAGVLVKAVKSDRFDTVQVPFNPVETVALEELLPLAGQMNLGTIAMKPFAGGAFKNKAACLKFILEKGFSVAIPGMDDVSQVLENVTAGEENAALSGAERELLIGEMESLGRAFCRRCEYCQPCPKGIDIPSVFLLDGYWSRYGLKEWAVERYQPLQAKISDCLECGECEEKCPYNLPIREMLKEAGMHLEKK